MIKKVTSDLEDSKYNTAIAAMMGAVNDLYRLKAVKLGRCDAWGEAVEALLMCMAPFAPHAAEELWHVLGHDDSINKDHWPQWNDDYLVTEQLTIAIQVNGKLRGEIQVAADATEDEVVNAAKAHEKVSAYLEGKQLRKTIYVAGKLVSFVV